MSMLSLIKCYEEAFEILSIDEDSEFVNIIDTGFLNQIASELFIINNKKMDMQLTDVVTKHHYNKAKEWRKVYSNFDVNNLPPNWTLTDFKQTLITLDKIIERYEKQQKELYM